MGHDQDGRGLAVGDLDNDGRLDLLIVPQNQPLAYFHNRTGGGRSLMFCGHTDVVAGSPEQFRPELRDGRMYGRGAADMKAGVVAMLGAVRALREANLAGDIHLETVIEEECTGNGAAACRARGPRPDAAIIPEPFNHTALIAQVGVLWATVTRDAGWASCQSSSASTTG